MVDAEDGKEKSERKRQREKQRRSELTNAFDDLSALVLKMDNADEEAGGEGSSRKKNRRMSARSETHDNENSGGMTRVDLINRALAIMKRLHQENIELKQSLSRSGGADKNEVMVMVPTLTPANDTAPPPAASVGSSFRPPYPGFPPLGQEHPQPPMYGASQSRYPPPPQQGVWGPFPGSGASPYGGSAQMDLHDQRR